jgi:CRISPR-associated protein Csb1
VEVYKSDAGWGVEEAKAGKKAKKVRPSEINHGNIMPSVEPLGVTCDYALQTAVITFAGLRRLRFGDKPAHDAAARAYLAALGLLALLEQDASGYSLRSRCDLVCEGSSPLELVSFDCGAETFDLDVVAARALHEEAFNEACAAGFKLDPTPLRSSRRTSSFTSSGKASAGRSRIRAANLRTSNAGPRHRMADGGVRRYAHSSG